MKFLIYIYYFLRSVLLRGPFNTLRLLKAEHDGEKKFGIKTSVFKKSESTEFFHYQGASYLVLLRIFREITTQTKDFDFIDIGCGKGRVIFVAEYCGYNSLTGIELDAELLIEAEKNKIVYPLKRKISNITFIHVNALDHVFLNKPSVYFLFNPFNAAVMRQVLERIVRATQCEAWFVYMNPLYKDVFSDLNFERVKEFRTGFYDEAIIFRLKARSVI